MSREKQIAEMAQTIRKEVWADGEICRKDCKGCDCFDYRKAEILYNAGFRKQPDTPNQNQFTNSELVEMKNEVCICCSKLMDCHEHLKGICGFMKMIEMLYEIGYRKQNEVIKEFAERLKESLDISTCGFSSEEVTYDVELTIDRLVEKMKGGVR